MLKPYVPCSDEEYFQRLIKEAPHIEGWHSNTETLEDIEWLDRDLLAKSKPFFQKHRLVLSASTGIAALFGIPFKNISLPFMQTGTLSASSVKTVKRTVKHVTHFVEWFSRGVTEVWVYNDIQKIKKMHAFLAKNIKHYEPPADELVPDYEKHLKFKEAVEKDVGELKLENAFAEINRYNPDIQLSQFDMVIIQLDLLCGFVQPSTHGIGDKEKLEGYVHHWAVVGRLLGIEDRFNIALHPSRDLHNRILWNLMSCMLTMDLTLSTLFEAHLEGVALYFHIPGPSAPATVLYCLLSRAHPDFKGNHLYALMGWKDVVSSGVLSGIFKLLDYSDFMKGFIRSTGTLICSRASTGYHKLSREDKLKLPAEFV